MWKNRKMRGYALICEVIAIARSTVPCTALCCKRQASIRGANIKRSAFTSVFHISRLRCFLLNLRETKLKIINKVYM
jgi:hypothetical protein